MNVDDNLKKWENVCNEALAALERFKLNLEVQIRIQIDLYAN